MTSGRLWGGADRGDDMLLGSIYDAPFDPDLWVPVMEQLTRKLSGEVACMTTLDVFTGDGSGCAALVPGEPMGDYLSTWAQNNPLHHIDDPLAYLREWRPATIRYEDWIDRQTLDRSDFFNEFLRPIGADHGMMMGLALVGTSTVTMNIARSRRRDVFADDEIALACRWQGHLSRAVRLGRQVQIGQAALDAVDQLVAATPQCLFFVDEKGRPQRMSMAAEAMLAAGSELCVRDGVLAAGRSDEDAALRRLIASAALREGTASPAGSMLLRRAGGGFHELGVTPLGPRASAIWSAAPMILVTVTESRAQALPIDLRLRDRFGLTPAEARVALALARGDTLRDTAEAASVSVHTVRAQLGAIFAKTGCRRQADLVRTLATFEQGR